MEWGPPRPVGVDPGTPSSARVYDYLLGGTTNYAVDREVVAHYLRLDPQAPEISRTNRRFGMRVARYLAQQGIDQFLDLGSGIPTSPPNLHDTVWAIVPTARVVYVDYDPIAVADSAALRASDRTTTVLADIRDTREVLTHPELVRTLDLSRPVGMVSFSVLQGIADPARLMATYTAHLAPGSFLGLSHMSDRSDPDARERAETLIATSGFPPTAFRTDAQVRAMFGDLQLVEPGLVEITDWRPDEPGPDLLLTLVGGVARKPGRHIGQRR